MDADAGAPWHLRLQARLAALESAAAALQAVCAEPGAQDALEARDLGFASAVAVAQMSAAPALQRLDLAAVKVQSVRDTLTCFRGAASAARELVTGFAHVPPAVLLRILSFLPVDARARATLVCCSWRDCLADPVLWTVLDLSPESGVRRPVTEDVLHGAAARARGQLVELNVDGCEELTTEAVLAAVTANRCLLKLSTVGTRYTFHERFMGKARAAAKLPRELAIAAPQLVSFRTNVRPLSLAEAAGMLRREAPFGALEPHDFVACYCAGDEDGDAAALAFCSALSTTQTSPQSLRLECFPLDLPGAHDALYSASILRQLRSLQLIKCFLTPESLPALASMIRGGVLETLVIINHDSQLFDASAACGLVADAIATNRTLTDVGLLCVSLWDDAAAATALLRALTGHPTLGGLDISFNLARDQNAAGAALGRLVAANAPALKQLVIESCELRDDGLRPLLEALTQNTHLLNLYFTNNPVSCEFARDVVVPAVRANTSLRKLGAGQVGQPPILELCEAVGLVMARGAVV